MNIIHPEKHLIIPVQDHCEGWFESIVAIRPDGTRRHLAGPFRNLITDGGLDRPGTSSACYNYCKVGSGNTTPQYTDTALTTYVAVSGSGSAGSNTVPGVAPYYVQRQITYTFAQGAAAGNLQEIGTSWSNAGNGNLFSRALILDGGGLPTTITVLADEILEVTYQFRYYANASDIAGTLNGYDYTLRAANAASVNASGTGGPGAWGLSTLGFQGGVASTSGFPACNVYAGAIGLITGNPSGTTLQDSSRQTIGSYTNGNHYRDFTCGFGLSSGNIAGGIMSVRAAHYVGNIQAQFTPVIAKDNTKLLTFTFRHRWARRDPL